MVQTNLDDLETIAIGHLLSMILDTYYFENTWTSIKTRPERRTLPDLDRISPEAISEYRATPSVHYILG